MCVEQLGYEGYMEMGKKGGFVINEMFGGEVVEVVGCEIDEFKFMNQQI